MVDAIRVLMVEDNPGDAGLVRAFVSGQVTLDMVVGENAGQALAWLGADALSYKRAVPAGIRLDLGPPGTSACESLARIREREDLRPVPVDVPPSWKAAQDICQSHAIGTKCHMSKPPEAEAVQSAVRSIEKLWFKVVRLPCRIQ